MLSEGLIGIFLSSAGVLQALKYRGDGKRDHDQLLVELEKMIERLGRTEQGIEMLHAQLGRMGIAVSEVRNIPRSTLPPDNWAHALSSHVAAEQGDVGILIARSADDRLRTWQVRRSDLQTLLHPEDVKGSRGLKPLPDEDREVATALALLQNNQTTLSIALLERLVDMRRSGLNWRILNNLAVAYLRAGRTNDALTVLERISPLRNHDGALVAFNKGIILYELNRFDDAIREFEHSLHAEELVGDALAAIFDCGARLTKI